MDTANPAILCTKVDEHAGDWPSTSFVQLFAIAKRCVESKLDPRPEIADVSVSMLCHSVCVLCTCIYGGCMYEWGVGVGRNFVLI